MFIIFSCDYWPHLYIFFGEMSIQALCSFWNGCCCWVIRVLCMFWILDPYQRYMIHKYSFPFHGLPFHSVHCVLWCIVLNFDITNLPIFSFVSCGFGVISKKSLPNPMPWSFLLVSLQEFYSFRPYIYMFDPLWVNFCIQYDPISFFCMWISSFPNIMCLKQLSFFILMLRFF